MALSEPLGNFFSIGVPSGLLWVRIDKSQGMTITAAAAEGRYDDYLSHILKTYHVQGPSLEVRYICVG